MIKIAVISDVHIMGPGEHRVNQEAETRIGADATRMRRLFRRYLFRFRRRFWNTHPESRTACFHKALDVITEYEPDWVIANGDYGGDASGVGLSNEHTFDSAKTVVDMIRERFSENSRFVFGDHDIGKYATNIRKGGIRLDSLRHGEEKLGIRSFWHEQDQGLDLIGINSVLFTLDLFLPEALDDEIPEWKTLRDEHRDQVANAFEGLEKNARVLLFCHDPFALGAISELPSVQRHLNHIQYTVLGHLHSPALLKVAKLARGVPRWNPKYPVARIINEGLRGVKSWNAFSPVVCPSTFGTGHHIPGGVLFVESDGRDRLVVRRRRIQI